MSARCFPMTSSMRNFELAGRTRPATRLTIMREKPMASERLCCAMSSRVSCQARLVSSFRFSFFSAGSGGATLEMYLPDRSPRAGHGWPPSALRAISVTADRQLAHHEVIEKAFLLYRRPGIPVTLEDNGVQPIGRVATDPVQRSAGRLELAIDPQLEHAVGLARRIQLHVRFDAVPLPDVRRVEYRSIGADGSKPPEIGKV